MYSAVRWHFGMEARRCWRVQLYLMTYIMKEICKQLTGMFSQYGFDSGRDVEAITTNHWAHIYAYEYMELCDPVWEKGEASTNWGESPLVVSASLNPTPMPKCYQPSMQQCMRWVGEVVV